MSGHHLHWSLRLALVALVGGAGAHAPCSADTIWLHRLIFAAHSSVPVTNVEIDEITDQMNTVMGKSEYGDPWDAVCPAVRFIRDGNVIRDDGIRPSGPVTDVVASVRQRAPQANVVVVNSVECRGNPSAPGCDLQDTEPLVVSIYTDQHASGQLWLHERGHAVGLRHSEESPTQAQDVPPQVGKNIMFWWLGVDQLGKTRSDCQRFMSPVFGSVVWISTDDTAAAPAIPSSILNLLAAAPGATNGALSTPAATRAVPESAEALTAGAYHVIAPPWIHGMPLEEIKALTEEDLQSIRRMLRGPANAYWPQAFSVLAAAGGEGDLPLMNRALELPMPDFPSESGDREARERYRTLLRIKLSAPPAIGIVANRFRSAQAVEALKGVADLKAASRAIGDASAAELSKQALHGLALANTPASRQYLQSLPTNVAPMTAQERSVLLDKAVQVNQLGLDAVLKQGRDTRSR